jgi:hypothetical protein
MYNELFEQSAEAAVYIPPAKIRSCDSMTLEMWNRALDTCNNSVTKTPFLFH